MSDAIILAIVATVVPTVTVILTYLSSRAARANTNVKIEQVHEVVNSKHAESLAIVEALKSEIRRLNTAPGVTTAVRGEAVTLSADGSVSVSKDSLPVQVPPPALGATASPRAALARIAELEEEIRRLRDQAIESASR